MPRIQRGGKSYEKLISDYLQTATLTSSGDATIGGDLTVTGSLDAGSIGGIVTTGTWTPTIGDGTNDFTTTTAVGEYRKIENQYFCNIRVIWNSKGSASGNIEISLPDTSIDDSVNGTIGISAGVTFDLSTGEMISAHGTGNSLNFYRVGSDTSATPVFLSDSSFGNFGEIHISVNFSVAV